MANDKRIVYQFPVSHYCEKTRWNLDAKGLSYETHNVVPGLHLLSLKRRSGVRTVPMLDDRGKAVGDSTAIALHLEEVYPQRPLIPRDAAARSRVLKLDAYFVDVLGVAIRQWLYGELMREKAGGAADVLFDGYPLPVRLLGKLAAPRLERQLKKMYRINDDGIAKARASILAAADRLESESQRDPSCYLVGGSLTLADITAASLFAPLIVPPGSPYQRTALKATPAIHALRNALLERPAGKWVFERYKNDRTRLAAE